MRSAHKLGLDIGMYWYFQTRGVADTQTLSMLRFESFAAERDQNTVKWCVLSLRSLSFISC